MKQPNGQGSIVKLKDTARRKPYIVRVTTGWSFEDGKAKQIRKVIGSYKTKAEAMQALLNYNANPYDLDNRITMGELFEKWFGEYSKKLKGGASARTITSAWKYAHEIYGMRVSDVRTRHIKGVLESAHVIVDGNRQMASTGTKSRLKSVFNLLFDYACEYELADKNYARLFGVEKDEEPTNSHIAFTEDEMAKLWEHTDNLYVRWVLIQCYTGFRPKELVSLTSDCFDGMTVVGGMKTAAGTNRSVPVHDRVLPFLDNSHEYLIWENGRLTYDMYRRRFDKAMELCGLSGHRAHDPRKTFVTMAKKYGMDEYAIKRICGHAITDITEKVYTERSIDWLRSEIHKIP